MPDDRITSHDREMDAYDAQDWADRHDPDVPVGPLSVEQLQFELTSETYWADHYFQKWQECLKDLQVATFERDKLRGALERIITADRDPAITTFAKEILQGNSVGIKG